MMRPSSPRRTAQWRFSRRKKGTRRQLYHAMPAAEAPWAITVAPAAPATPQPRPSTNQRSSAMFTAVDTPRNTSGAAELPTERSRQAK